MDISVIIAQVVGIFLVVAGIAMVVNSKAVAVAIEESVQNKGVLFVWGLLALGTGAVIVVFNNAWTSGLPLLITILGWLALIKGAFILIFSAAAASFYKKFGKSGMLVFCGAVALVLGIVLLYW
jgi:hypothetical protein